MHKLIIHNLGPISECELICTRFIALTGEQASGKSTIAKALYYFRTFKNDILDAVTSIMPSKFMKDSAPNKTLIKILRDTLRKKFLRTFGYSVRELRKGMRIKYYYTKESVITVRLITDKNNSFILNVHLSEALVEFINEYEKYIMSDVVNVNKNNFSFLQSDINKFLDDTYETIYIPSGRSMLALLSSYVQPFSFQQDKNNLDYCTQKYIEAILSIKPELSGGAEGITDYYRTGSNIPSSWEKARELVEKVICGSYKIENGEERILLKNGDYVRINFASSGQQDALWITNLLYYYLVQKRPVMFIIEEPESHLFPSSQKYIIELISLVCNQGHSMLVTTHSPYILGALNNLLYASSFKKTPKQKEAEKIIHPYLWLDYDKFQAWFVSNGKLEDCRDKDIKQMKNEIIDGISDVINSEYDALLELNCEEDKNAAE